MKHFTPTMNPDDVSGFAKALGTAIDVNADDGEDDRSVEEIVVECQEEFPDFTVPTILAAICSDELGLKTLVRRHKLDVNSVDKDGCTAARAAAEFGNAEILATLASLGADLDRADAGGESPAYAAAEHEGGTILRLLRCAGCDMDRAADNGDTPAHVAATNGDADCLRALVEEDYLFSGGPAGYEEDFEPSRRRKEGSGSDAAEAEDTRVAVKPSDLGIRNPKTGKTPADCAAEEGHKDCVEFITQACAAVAMAERLTGLVSKAKEANSSAGDSSKTDAAAAAMDEAVALVDSNGFSSAAGLDTHGSGAGGGGKKKGGGGGKKKGGGGGGKQQQQGPFYYLFRASLEAVSAHRMAKDIQAVMEADLAMSRLVLEEDASSGAGSGTAKNKKNKQQQQQQKGDGAAAGTGKEDNSDVELVARLVELAGTDWASSISPAKLRAMLLDAGVTGVSEKRVKGLKKAATAGQE